MKLSNQALMSIMVALQKSLMEQTDIVPVLKAFDLELNDASELEVTNPPTQIAVPKSTLEEEF